ncbi:MAG: hypothetical protein FRX49_12349 [Trebouxia sp. A1-2]|nr:MAG: hypothetical protein FRX49_12349 [Trebouxia sp. A1-2]
MALSIPQAVAALKAMVSVLAIMAATHTWVPQPSARKTRALGGQEAAKIALEHFLSLRFAHGGTPSLAYRVYSTV